MYDKIKQLADARGETISDMCAATGISQSTISNLKSRNSSLSAANTCIVAKHYGVAPEYLLPDKED